ncbi:winged helix-turn-helix transcriptional regulator [Ruania halotolerans]|uniref:winged helix-turn-helix transcriptional regulator n=1 Tax=Ruania halotolerans TaxID=2897773 RepID=UPI001E49F3F3|nr:helix-turn-helix domain-containing protein [Ruania halotolerans]UFU06116.1 helix-turn-helix transcriptional regulator [Ruania halotolerans]
MRTSVVNALAVCPVEVAISAVGGAWKLTIVKHLLTGTLRFGELRRAVGPVSERTLARQLRELETDGLIHREVYAEVPPRVEYSLTGLGASLREVVTAMDAWGAVLSREVETEHRARPA